MCDFNWEKSLWEQGLNRQSNLGHFPRPINFFKENAGNAGHRSPVSHWIVLIDSYWWQSSTRWGGWMDDLCIKTFINSCWKQLLKCDVGQINKAFSFALLLLAAVSDLAIPNQWKRTGLTLLQGTAAFFVSNVCWNWCMQSFWRKYRLKQNWVQEFKMAWVGACPEACYNNKESCGTFKTNILS